MAEWVKSDKTDGMGYPIYKCSECGEQSIHDMGMAIGPTLSLFCPWCGAKMPDWYEEQMGVDYECCMVYKSHIEEMRRAFRRPQNGAQDTN